MLYTIAVVLVLLWLLGMVTSYTINGFIHILPTIEGNVDYRDFRDQLLRIDSLLVQTMKGGSGWPRSSSTKARHSSLSLCPWRGPRLCGINPARPHVR